MNRNSGMPREKLEKGTLFIDGKDVKSLSLYKLQPLIKK